MLQTRLILFVLLLFTIRSNNGAKIFCIFTTASYSHQQPMIALSRALAARGHNMTVITTNPSEVPIENLREIDMNHLYSDLMENMKEIEKQSGFTTQKRKPVLQSLRAMCNIQEFMNKMVYDSPNIQQLIKEMNDTKPEYDLIIYEPLLGTSLLGFADLIGNPPVVGILTFSSPSVIDNLFGNPIIPSYIPNTFSPFDDRMTFWERVMNLFYTLYFDFITNMYIRPMHEKFMWNNFGNTGRRLHDLEYNHSLLIVSTDLATGTSRPVHSNTIYVGPMHVEATTKPLPQDIQKWMDNAEDGVIYFSLGSNMKSISMPQHIRQAFIDAFKQFPKIRVLWKWEDDNKIPGQPDNVLNKKWIPQQPVLAHPKLKLFISQVGLQSFEEATYYGVPILGVPMFGDQDTNVKKLISNGGGRRLEFESITSELVYENLKEMLTNTSYKKNMLRLSKITKDKPMSALDTAVWWVEYVLRHNGAPHLRPSCMDLKWYQYYMLDVLALYLSISLILVYSLYCILCKVYKCLIAKPNIGEKIKTN